MRNKSNDLNNTSNLISINFTEQNVINLFCKTVGNCLIFKQKNLLNL